MASSNKLAELATEFEDHVRIAKEKLVEICTEFKRRKVESKLKKKLEAENYALFGLDSLYHSLIKKPKKYIANVTSVTLSSLRTIKDEDETQKQRSSGPPPGQSGETTPAATGAAPTKLTRAPANTSAINFETRVVDGKVSKIKNLHFRGYLLLTIPE